MAILPEPRDIEIAEWSVLKENDRPVGIALQIPVDIVSGGCGRFGPTWDFRWNGSNFDLTEIHLPPVEELEADLWCTDWLLASTLMNAVRSGATAAIQTIQDLFPYYTYPEGGQYGRGSVPSMDEVHFEFGLRLANLGDVPKARQQMTEIISHSMITKSLWTEPASQFLDSYHSKNDLLAACEVTHRCYPTLDVDALVNLIPVENYSDALSILQASGITITQSAEIDFNADGIDEYWFVQELEHGFGSKLWIISHDLTKVYVQLETYSLCCDHRVLELTPLRNLGKEAVYLFSSQNYNASFAWRHDLVTKRWSAVPLDHAISHILATCWDGLLEGTSPRQIIEQLLPIYQAQYPQLYRPIFDDELLQLNYILGLAYELGGDRQKAAMIYLHLWQTYPDSPYALIAHSKLGPVP